MRCRRWGALQECPTAFARLQQNMDGHILALLVMAVAAAEAALALAVVILLHKQTGKLDTNVFSLLKG